MASNVLTVELVGGVKCPMVGLGTYTAKDDVMKAATKAAIDAGYRHFDTADFYKVCFDFFRAFFALMFNGFFLL